MFSYINRFFDVDKYLEENHMKALHQFDKNQIMQLYKFALNQNIKAGISEVYVISKYENLARLALKELNLNGCVLAQNDFESAEGIYINSLLDWEENQLDEISMMASKKPIYINFYTSLEEAGQIDNIYGKSPAQVLEDFGFLDRECYLIGCNYVEKDELDIIASSGGKVILTPTSDMINGNGAVNIMPFINRDIKILLGTKSSPNLNLKKELFLAKGNTANLLHVSIYDKSLDFELETKTFKLKSDYDETESLKIILGEEK